jgi:hypothetical protein
MVAREPIRYARNGEVSIAYRVGGDGPVDLLFIGGIVSDLEIGVELAPAQRFYERLGSLARVIAFDKRGTAIPIAAITGSHQTSTPKPLTSTTIHEAPTRTSRSAIRGHSRPRPREIASRTTCAVRPSLPPSKPPPNLRLGHRQLPRALAQWTMSSSPATNRLRETSCRPCPGRCLHCAAISRPVRRAGVSR